MTERERDREVEEMTTVGVTVVTRGQEDGAIGIGRRLVDCTRMKAAAD